ncbi:formimidoylglutamate deiminase [Wenzhouxiangella marina]|uniref:N-formimino-L-glutamate deiminase n=1 Tax=Wenzhouxiangella marina TaxID=1579979 RepID=A0A0K0XYR8_9GAMM|nr:formimidoylglutamate deiminase [Wenzhouxiangella marina]AKS42839.1 N-formimino-L-glutamate deiminase [Wenzhouxiangella marina]MBB6087480.1 formimidoylglutamate deiminase [Wenzhouxiangella marina]
MRAFDCPWLLTPEGWRAAQRIRVDTDDRIESIEAIPESPGAGREAEVLSGPVIPGMCNVHSHAHQRLIAGLTGWREQDRSSFWSWRERMYRALSSLNPDQLETVACWLYMELLEGGYTCTGEFHYAHRLAGQAPLASSEALLSAASRAGCGLTLLPVWYRYGGFGKRPLDARQQAFGMSQAEFLDLLHALQARLQDGSQHRLGMAPHSLRAVDVDELAELVRAWSVGPVHLHIAEQPDEVRACLEHAGARPVELLFDRLEPDARWCLIHATHVEDFELEAMRRAGVTAGICPTTEADLGDGIFPALRWRQLGGRLAIGSDSNLVTSAAAELRQLDWSQRLVHHQRNVLLDEGQTHLGTSLWARTARDGAHALDQNGGALEVGRLANFVVLDSGHPLLAGLDPASALDTFIMAEQPGMIESVWVAAERRVHHGIHVGRNELAEEISALRRRLVNEIRQ